jgi:hypothetical protein
MASDEEIKSTEMEFEDLDECDLELILGGKKRKLFGCT